MTTLFHLKNATLHLEQRGSFKKKKRKKAHLKSVVGTTGKIANCRCSLLTKVQLVRSNIFQQTVENLIPCHNKVYFLIFFLWKWERAKAYDMHHYTRWLGEKSSYLETVLLLGFVCSLCIYNFLRKIKYSSNLVAKGRNHLISDWSSQHIADEEPIPTRHDLESYNHI